MSEGRYYRLAYSLPGGHTDRELRPFQLRDGEAGRLMSGAVEKYGYTCAGSIINYPSPGPDLIPVDVSRLRGNDLILLTTRPPMDNIGDRKAVQRSYTTLEDDLFNLALRKYFQRCTRSEVLLTDEVAKDLAGDRRRQSCQFRQNGGADYYAYGSPATNEWRHFARDPQPLTAAFLIYEEHVWPGGPALLVAFGMGGNETLWSHLLAKQLSHLLFTTSFAMAELRAPRLAKQPMWTEDFAAAWEVEILGVAQPKPGSGPRRAA